MESLADALKRRIQQAGVASSLSATALIEVAQRVLPEQVRATTFHNSVLTVTVPKGSDAYFFKQELETHCERINAALGSQGKVEKIRVRILP